MRHKADDTQKAIVQALRACFCSVYVINGTIDLVVGIGGETHLAECKTPDKNGKFKFKDSQIKLMEEWRGSPVLIFTSPEQAIAEAMRIRGKQR